MKNQYPPSVSEIVMFRYRELFLLWFNFVRQPWSLLITNHQLSCIFLLSTIWYFRDWTPDSKLEYILYKVTYLINFVIAVRTELNVSSLLEPTREKGNKTESKARRLFDEAVGELQVYTRMMKSYIPSASASVRGHLAAALLTTMVEARSAKPSTRRRVFVTAFCRPNTLFTRLQIRAEWT